MVELSAFFWQCHFAVTNITGRDLFGSDDLTVLALFVNSVIGFCDCSRVLPSRMPRIKRMTSIYLKLWQQCTL